MVEIKGVRGSGKTTKLLYLAQGTGAIIVEPNCKMADFVKQKAAELKLDNVEVIGMHEFINHYPFGLCHDKKFLIDEIDIFLAILNVEGYTKTV